MFPAWVYRRQALKRLALFFLFAGLRISAGAQDVPKVKPPSARTIILPPKMIAGAPATLAVLDSAGRLLSNVAVDLSGGKKVTTDATGRALFAAPAEAGKLTAKIPGTEISAFASVVMPEESAIKGATDELRVDSYPHFLSIYDRFTLEGRGFRGVADVNHVFLADQACLVLASSPISLVALPGPKAPIGATALRASVAGYDSGMMPVSAVLLEFSGPLETPNAGTQGKVILKIHGATESLSVEVRNGSPEIIQLPHGNVQRLVTSGGEENIAPVELKFLAAGNYTLTARLIPGSPASASGTN